MAAIRAEARGSFDKQRDLVAKVDALLTPGRQIDGI